MTDHRIYVRLSKTEYLALSQFAKKHDMALAHAMRVLTNQQLAHDALLMDFPHYQPYGKQSLMRSERLADFSCILSTLILKTMIRPDKFQQLKQQALNALHARWDYENDDSTLVT